MKGRMMERTKKLNELLGMPAENEVVEFKEAKNGYSFTDLCKYFSALSNDLLCKALKEHGGLTRQEIDELLWKKLPEWMTEEQRKNKVGNLLTELRKKKFINNKGLVKRPEWVLLNQELGEN